MQSLQCKLIARKLAETGQPQKRRSVDLSGHDHPH